MNDTAEIAAVVKLVGETVIVRIGTRQLEITREKARELADAVREVAR